MYFDCFNFVLYASRTAFRFCVDNKLYIAFSPYGGQIVANVICMESFLALKERKREKNGICMI